MFMLNLWTTFTVINSQKNRKQMPNSICTHILYIKFIIIVHSDENHELVYWLKSFVSTWHFNSHRYRWDWSDFPLRLDSLAYPNKKITRFQKEQKSDTKFHHLTVYPIYKFVNADPNFNAQWQLIPNSTMPFYNCNQFNQKFFIKTIYQYKIN